MSNGIILNTIRKESKRPLRKVRKFYQISLPTRLSKKFGIAEGDYVEMEEVRDGILVKPVSVTARVPAARFTLKEQKLLEKTADKITKINAALVSAKGLTKNEARIAAKAGLIEPAQSGWGMESWQKREREAEGDVRAGRVSRSFENVEALIKDLGA
jgi:AbrB family looped-hinge helix DNA binding protein